MSISRPDSILFLLLTSLVLFSACSLASTSSVSPSPLSSAAAIATPTPIATPTTSPTIPLSPTTSPTPWVNPFGRVENVPSPNGKWVAVLDTRVGSLDLDANGKTFNIFSAGSTASEVKWSPDSLRLFVVRMNFVPSSSSMELAIRAPIQIWQTRIAGETPQPSSLAFQSPNQPPEQIDFGNWSPDNRYFFFWLGMYAGDVEADGMSYWAMNVETGKVVALADAALLNPRYQSWSPDGSALAFTAGGYRSAQVGKLLSIFNAKTGVATTVVSETEMIPGIVAWSPRDDLVAYAAVLASDSGMDWADYMGFDNPAILKRRVYMLDAKTGKHWRLNAVNAFQDAPTWGDDGAVLYYVQREGDDMVLMAANPATGQARAILGTRRPAPHAVGYYGQSDWDDLLAYRPNAPRAPVPALSESFSDTTDAFTLRYPRGWQIGKGWKYLIYECPDCATFSAEAFDSAPPNFAPFSGKSFIAVHVTANVQADLDALVKQMLASAGPGQILDRSATLTAFDQRRLSIDGKPAMRLETMGEFGEVNHVLVVLNGTRALDLRGQGDGRVFNAVVGTLKLP